MADVVKVGLAIQEALLDAKYSTREIYIRSQGRYS